MAYSPDQWYIRLQQAFLVDQLLRDQWEAVARFDPQHTIKLVIEDRGCRHPAGTGVTSTHFTEQMTTLRDDAVAAITLEILSRHGDIQSHNTFARPRTVVPVTAPLSVSGSSCRHSFLPGIGRYARTGTETE